MRVLLATILLGASLLVGCASGKVRTPLPPPAFSQQSISVGAPSTPKLIVTPTTMLVGKVAKVNIGSRFVVVNFAGGQLPALGQVLPVYRGGLKVGELKMNGPQLEDNLVGDLVAGEAQSGDDVREN